jgi:hypothetical protein
MPGCSSWWQASVLSDPALQFTFQLRGRGCGNHMICQARGGRPFGSKHTLRCHSWGADLSAFRLYLTIYFPKAVGEEAVDIKWFWRPGLWALRCIQHPTHVARRPNTKLIIGPMLCFCCNIQAMGFSPHQGWWGLQLPCPLLLLKLLCGTMSSHLSTTSLGCPPPRYYNTMSQDSLSHDCFLFSSPTVSQSQTINPLS